MDEEYTTESHRTTGRVPEDVTGQRFGTLTALRRVGTRWVFRCDCGGERTAMLGYIRFDMKRGRMVSCAKCCVRSSPEDMTGQRFGLLVAVAPTRDANGQYAWVWRCDCGRERVAQVYDVRSPAKPGIVVSCGCTRSGRKAAASGLTDLVGRRFGRLVALERTERHGKATWRCRCDCGAESVVVRGNLLHGTTRSCGCLKREVTAKGAHVTHGATRGTYAQFPREYGVWRTMISRCTNPNVKRYGRYGARGIRVCERWLHDFATFFADMGPRPSPKHSIERKNTDGHYEPDNCCWATHRAQMNNTSTNRRITAFSRTLTVAEWMRETGLSRATISKRLDRGMPPEEALSRAARSARAVGTQVGNAHRLK